MKKTLLVICFLASAVLFLPSADGALITYEAILSGANEAPPNASPGTGYALIDIDTVANTMRVQATFSGLISTGTTTAAHIHAATATPFAGTAGVATTVPSFTGFPLGVTSGIYDHLFNLLDPSSYNPAYITAHGGTAATAEVDLLLAMAEGKAYFNIHTTTVPAGEIRGFLTPVPEPSTLLTLGSGLLGLVCYGRKRMRK